MATKNTDKEKSTEKMMSVNQAELEKIIRDNMKKISAAGKSEYDEVESKPAKYEAKKAMTKEQEEFLNEKVPLYLVKDNNEYSDDVTVTFNGTNYRIKRGVTVMVPRFLKLVVESNLRQKMVSNDFAVKLARSFENKSERVLMGAKVESGIATDL